MVILMVRRDNTDVALFKLFPFSHWQPFVICLPKKWSSAAFCLLFTLADDLQHRWSVSLPVKDSEREWGKTYRPFSIHWVIQYCWFLLQSPYLEGGEQGHLCWFYVINRISGPDNRKQYTSISLCAFSWICRLEKIGKVWFVGNPISVPPTWHWIGIVLYCRIKMLAK